MSLKDDITKEIKSIFATQWNEQSTAEVPAPEDLRLNSNHAKNLDAATVLYADLDGSTNMVENYDWTFAAEVYKAYLRSAARIIRNETGVITAYDGDRIMAVFTGKTKNTCAVRCALKINSAVIDIIRPAIKAQYSNNDFTLNHDVGVDTSQLRTARIGVHGDNDLVWIGRSANYAAKLTTLPDKATWISKSVYDVMLDEVKFSNGKNMWEARKWTSMNDMLIYCSSYKWTIS